MSKFWSDTVKRVKPYVPGEQPKDRKYIKINTNENPYPPSPGVLEAIRNAAGADLRLYPQPDFDDLREMAARTYGVKKEQVFAGNGSDEVLAFAFMAFFKPGKPVLFPDITYTFYKVYVNLYNLDSRLVPVDDEFNIPVEQFFSPNGGIVLANPNAPTSKCLTLDIIRRIVEGNPDSVVIVDEAYIDFGGESAVGIIGEYPNLLVVHTMSKYRSLAGLRIGLAFGQEDLTEGLYRIKNSFNSYTINRISNAAAIQALKDEDYYRKIRERIIRTRNKVAKGLKDMGFKVMDSSANFLFISHPKHHARTLFTGLKERGILVRYFETPKISNYLRVSIGTEEEMECFLKTVGEITGR